MRWFGVLAMLLTGLLPLAAEILPASAAAFDRERLEIVPQETFPQKQGIQLKSGREARMPAPDKTVPPDLTFRFNSPETDRYQISIMGALTPAGAELLAKGKTKFDSLFAVIQINDQPPTRRVVCFPWNKADLNLLTLGKFTLPAGPNEIKLYLPAEFKLGQLDVRKYQPPRVPEEARNYQPTVAPPPEHPRIWITPALREKIKHNTYHPESKPYLEKVRAAADREIVFAPQAGEETSFHEELEQKAVALAFFHQIDGDREAGLAAVRLIRDYLDRVSFGNMLDITREIGRAIYSGALVYDWCFDLMTPADRDSIRLNMMRLADDMECGWPPFRQNIVNGHGNEAQINRDLVSMAIAIYDQDPEPFRYCAWWILERLVPMRAFEYQSPRHNQGLGYFAARLNWEMMGAHIWQRLNGKPVFHDNIKTVRHYQQYMRLPTGEMLRDGDGVMAGFGYFSPIDLTLLSYTYANDPVLKGEFFRQQQRRLRDHILFLLLNDPDLPADSRQDTLPTTTDCGDILSGMVARTSWQTGADSPAVVAEIKGGGYHFGNHQHSDAGSFQLYFRGMQMGDIGQYRFYGTPYDFDFNKRSIAHSMMLLYDPDETFYRNARNDGGIRLNQVYPHTPEDVVGKNQFDHGRVLACAFGPDSFRPEFSYFAVDLTGAYGPKADRYVRSFVFLATGQVDVPAVIVIYDQVATAKPEFKKYWQVNCFKKPEFRNEVLYTRNEQAGHTGTVRLEMLLPRPDQRQVEVQENNWVFGRTYDNPRGNELNGYQVLYTPAAPAAADRFLAVLQMLDGEAAPLPQHFQEKDGVLTVRCGGYLLLFPAVDGLLDQEIPLELPAATRLVATGLAPGDWLIGDRRFTVKERQRALYTELPAGRHQLHKE